MAKILSIDLYRKETSQARLELSNGEVYLIGFMSLEPVENKDLYTKALERIANAFEKGDETDLSNYVSYRMACEKLVVPLYVSPDRNGERERIGQRIRELRVARGMEAKMLARLSQIDAANVSRIEQGKYSVGLDILSKIALALDSRVEIVPNWSSFEKGSFLSMTRKVWVIPTLDVSYNPIATVPGCGFSLWPYNGEANINIGDLVVFYMTNEKRYADPFLVSATQFKHDELGMHEWVFPSWPASEKDCYLKVEYHTNLSEADAIHIREAVQKIKGEPTQIIEIKL